MHRIMGVAVVVLGTIALVLAGAPGAGASTGPGVLVTPDVGLRDGDTVHVTALDFFNLTSPLDATPSAYQCRGGVFPASSTGPLEAAPALRDLLLQHCARLGSFPVRGTNFDPAPATSLDVVVHTTVVLGDGSTLRCGAIAGDCVIAAAGLTPPSNVGVATAPITFAPPTPRSAAECKRGGWRRLTDDAGRPFANQGGCIRFVAAS